MRIAFTLCSINYLGQAKTLGDSLLKHNPDYKYMVGLVDKNTHSKDLTFMNGIELLDVEKIGIEGFEEMYSRYNIVELITAVKPFYFNYLFAQYPEAESIIYFDPDIMVFDNLDTMHHTLESNHIILTPHFTSPILDNLLPTEKHVYSTGVFNLGYVAMKRGKEARKLNDWWMKKLRYECILDLTRGYFVDQLWMNLAPAYFDGVVIEKHPGYNTAHWNLHERTISQKDGKYFVNNSPLIFYHFSHYNAKKPDKIASYHTRFNFINRPDIKPLYENYLRSLTNNKYFELIDTPCFYVNNSTKKEVIKNVKGFLRKNIPLGIKIKLAGLLNKK